MKVHIVSFNVPWPADYGGVIDVFHKIRHLHQAGVEVFLHCFDYGRGPQKELDQYCKQVFYYPRKKTPRNFFSPVPFIVRTRCSEELIKNLSAVEAPVIFEALHSCFFLSHPLLSQRLKIYRESNIEHRYYFELFKSEASIARKAFFLVESMKLRVFQRKLKHADVMAAVNSDDQKYLQEKFPGKRVEYISSFHAFDSVDIMEGSGDFILYHGNLSVPENDEAAIYLLENVFDKLSFPVVIAGKGPGKRLTRLCQRFDHVTLVANPEEQKMRVLLSKAHIHCLITYNPSGLKLKLLNVLFGGRHILVNKHMLHGTLLHGACTIADTPEDLVRQINELVKIPFTSTMVLEREEKIQQYSNQVNLGKILFLLRNP